MSTLDDHPLANLGANPVSEASPCGENARYESDFELLEAELAKQESLSAETVDWSRVVDLAANILNNQSKDLLVGSYFCYGLLVKEGYSGLGVGIKVLGDMVENHWDCLFPPAKRMRARQTAFVWLAEKAAHIIADKTPAANESEHVVAAADLLRRLDSELVEKMGDQAPMLNDLSRPLKNYKQSAEAELARAQAASQPEPAPAPAAEPAAAAPAVEPAASVATEAKAPPPPPPPAQPAPAPRTAAPELPGGALESENDSKKAVRHIQTAIRDVAAFYLAAKLSDPRAYRMARVGAWMAVEKAPPDNDGQTQIAPPAAERLKFFDGKMASSEFLQILPELEKTLARAPFWLDGHFMVTKVLRQLGAEYDAAARTVISEVAGFLTRLPDVMSLQFSDGSPFASDQTRLWLGAEVLVAASAESGNEVNGAAGEAWESAFGEASKTAAGGDTGAAFEIVNIGLKQAGSRREQFYWRCTLARLLLQLGQASAASTLLEQIIDQLDEQQVAVWEPGLLALVYSLLHQSYSKQQSKKKEDSDLKAKTDMAYRKLCWFDPVNALSVKGG